MPISRLRSETENAMTPAIPTTARNNATAANVDSNTTTKRSAAIEPAITSSIGATSPNGTRSLTRHAASRTAPISDAGSPAVRITRCMVEGEV